LVKAAASGDEAANESIGSLLAALLTNVTPDRLEIAPRGLR
jgi:hypothetical protein